MPALTSPPTAANPVEGFRTAALPAFPTRPVRVYLPTDYQPKYAYPLVVLFHADGECEEQAVRLVPLLSRRNYVVVSVRGPVPLGMRADGRPAFAWSTKRDRAVKAALDYALSQYSIHTERIFAVGIREGAAAASRFALSKHGRVAGLVALNGTPLTCSIPANELRVLFVHGSANTLVAPGKLRGAARAFSAAGAKVNVSRFASTQFVHPEMLRAANRWIMMQVTGKIESDE